VHHSLGCDGGSGKKPEPTVKVWMKEGADILCRFSVFEILLALLIYILEHDHLYGLARSIPIYLSTPAPLCFK
jgi:hypothetical protein